MNDGRSREHIDTIVIGAGQAGLATGYHLKKRGLPFVILDGNERVGDSWRQRWDSLRLFTPACFDSLPGRPFPAPAYSFPTKDEMGDYLEDYARHFELPVRNNTRVERLSKEGDRFLVEAGDRVYEARQVVVAMGHEQAPKQPAFAAELDPGIVQMHSSAYWNPSQLREGGVLLVGAGNSGAEIAKELVRSRPVLVSGRHAGEVPFNVGGLSGRLLIRPVFRILFHRVMTVRTPIGRKVKRKVLTQGGPLIRVKEKHLAEMGVERLPRVAGVRDGLPLLEDGRVVDVPNVIWCTGYHPNFSWIDLPVLGEHEPHHRRGVVESQPGLFFVGLAFQYAFSSMMIQGVGRDAAYIAKAVERRVKEGRAVEDRGKVMVAAGE